MNGIAGSIVTIGFATNVIGIVCCRRRRALLEYTLLSTVDIIAVAVVVVVLLSFPIIAVLR